MTVCCGKLIAIDGLTPVVDPTDSFGRAEKDDEIVEVEVAIVVGGLKPACGV